MTHPRDILHAEIAKLRAENEELRERVRQFEAEASTLQYPREWDLTVTEEGVVDCIYRASPRTVSDTRITLDVWGDKGVNSNTLKVHIMRARQKLEAAGIELKNDWGRGYFIPRDSAEKIQRSLMQEAA